MKCIVDDCVDPSAPGSSYCATCGMFPMPTSEKGWEKLEAMIGAKMSDQKTQTDRAEFMRSLSGFFEGEAVGYTLAQAERELHKLRDGALVTAMTGGGDNARADSNMLAAATRAWNQERHTPLGAWADDGFHTIEAADDKFAAALMSTDATEVGIIDAPMPARAVVFRVPGDITRVNRVLVSALRLGAAQLEAWAAPPAAPGAVLTIRAPTMDDLLFSELEMLDEPDAKRLKEAAEVADEIQFRQPTPEEHREVQALRRYVAGMLIAYHEKRNHTITGLSLSRAKKLREVPPNHRFAILGSKSITCDTRESVRHFISHGGSAPSVQFIVRGHWRRQAHGPGHSQRKIIWIQPFWKGPEDALIVARAHAVKA